MRLNVISHIRVVLVLGLGCRLSESLVFVVREIKTLSLY